MPKIEWSGLPHEIQRHLFRKIRKRKLSEGDFIRLVEWAEAQPNAPDGQWYKDFGSFVLVGSGPYPKSVLTPGMKPKGKPL